MTLRGAIFWGGHLDGELGLLRPNHKRVVPLASLLVRVVRAKACCGGLLEGSHRSTCVSVANEAPALEPRAQRCLPGPRESRIRAAVLRSSALPV